MSSPQRQIAEETESFKAFELVADALENIDSFARSQKSDAALLEAEKHLTEALSDDNDPRYLKAWYLLAMVGYLKGSPEGLEQAISQFRGLLEAAAPDTRFGKELRYNIAAAYSAGRRWDNAATGFNALIRDTNTDPELRLLARAGLAVTCAERIVESRDRLTGLSNEKGERAAAERERNAGSVKELSGSLDAEYKSIKAELRHHYAGEGVDRKVAEEVVRILGEAYEKVDEKMVVKVSELLPAKAAGKRLKIPAGVKLTLLVIGVAALLSILYVHLFVGWDHFLKFVSSVTGE